MRRHIITLSLAIGLIASLTLAASIAAKPFDPGPEAPIVALDPESCAGASASAPVVPGGVYRAMVNELRQAGHSRAEIQAETADALVVPGLRSAARATRC
jgi:hypothetical protein